jgi:hypothetical protein
MRYMGGDPLVPFATVERSLLLDRARAMSPAEQDLLVDMAAETDAGARAGWLHYGIGGGVGLVVGALVAKLWRGR